MFLLLPGVGKNKLRDLGSLYIMFLADADFLMAKLLTFEKWECIMEMLTDRKPKALCLVVESVIMGT